ncbi:MAG: glycosyltransferase [Roseicyclus sp.]|nr:glycosyltransferase [Roseicyclus sp.]
MRISMIIPVYNGAGKIARTIDSALNQASVLSGQDSVTIHVVDGASTDATLAEVHSFADPRIRVTSEPDGGMYDALAKGLAAAGGDITCYLPAGETFEPQAFAIVSEIFAAFPAVHWLTGRSVTRNARGQIVESLLPHPYHRRFIDCGMHGTRLAVIQQESTFWRSALNGLVDLDRLRGCKLAGDYLLWKSFCARHPLHVVNAQLASFTIEPGQLSRQEPGAYRRELRSLRRRPAAWERAAALLLRQYVKRTRPGRTARRLLSYDHDRAAWHLPRP